MVDKIGMDRYYGGEHSADKGKGKEEKYKKHGRDVTKERFKEAEKKEAEKKEAERMKNEKFPKGSSRKRRELPTDVSQQKGKEDLEKSASLVEEKLYNLEGEMINAKLKDDKSEYAKHAILYENIIYEQHKKANESGNKAAISFLRKKTEALQNDPYYQELATRKAIARELNREIHKAILYNKSEYPKHLRLYGYFIGEEFKKANESGNEEAESFFGQKMKLLRKSKHYQEWRRLSLDKR